MTYVELVLFLLQEYSETHENLVNKSRVLCMKMKIQYSAKLTGFNIALNSSSNLSLIKHMCIICKLISYTLFLSCNKPHVIQFNIVILIYVILSLKKFTQFHMSGNVYSNSLTLKPMPFSSAVPTALWYCWSEVMCALVTVVRH